MTSNSVSQELIDKLEPVNVQDVDALNNGSHLDITIEAEKIRTAVEILSESKYFMEDLTAVDMGSYREMAYRFNQYSEPNRITIRVDLGPEDEIDSVQDIFSSADWLERECYEFLGVKFNGHPDLRNLLLPEDFDTHPLRKDFVVPKEALAPEYHKD